MPKATLTTDGIVYFLHAPSVKRLKIGFTTDLKHRLREHTLASPVPLVLVRQVRASFRVEHILHALFDCYRTHGEWYVAHKDLLKFVRRIKNGELLSLEKLVLK
jgi:hypothetical protein